ncbi:MAG: magnesium chelatase subunit D [Rhodospirillales bacterium]|jgi:magnesium chelatase subunit D|nr:magnesium chelatase subunit D [Rhodospirillales bacterium]
MSLDSPAAASPWQDAILAAMLFAVDPLGTVGVSLRASAGPARQHWLRLLHDLLPAGCPVHRIPLHVPDNRLLGGLDLAATLRSGRPVAERGILAAADGGVVLLAMAERLTAATAARLTGVLDRGAVDVQRDGLALCLPARFGVVALDEGLAEDEGTPLPLRDRLAFHADLSGVTRADLDEELPAADEVAAARQRVAAVTGGEEAIEALCTAALALGIASIRAPLLALRVARTAAALAARERIAQEDLVIAGRLVLAPRATELPMERTEPLEPAHDEPAQSPPAETNTPPADGDRGENESAGLDPADAEVVLQAVQAALPEGLLARLRLTAGDRAPCAAAGRVGALKPAAGRGRPAGVRRGDPRAGVRLNVVETLRAAAPWQPLRRQDGDGDGDGARGPRPSVRVHVRRDDFRINRFQQRSQTTSIFVVDASGSTALHRLAEAKGAVELLLADCYVRRDRVALFSMRGRTAELVLPPTRSLVRARRCLAGLPGGGGTPLATGIHAAASLADALRRRGETPITVLLTDGSANITLDGAAERQSAEEQALAAARRLRASQIAALLVDTSPRPRPAAQRIAEAMGATYLPLPYADASRLSAAVRAEAAAAERAASRR